MPIRVDRMDNGSYRSPDDPGEPVADQPRISVTDEEGRFLAWVAKNRTVLEIGTGLGVSTQHLSTARTLHTADIDPWVQDNVWPDLAETVACFYRDYTLARGPYDVVFIDGEHSTNQTRADATFAFGVCRGLVVVHDAHMESVREGLEGLADWNLLDTTHGIATAWSWPGD